MTEGNRRDTAPRSSNVHSRSSEPIRVYASSGSLALKTEAMAQTRLAAQPMRVPGPSHEPKRKPASVPQAKPAPRIKRFSLTEYLRKYKVASKTLVVACIALLAAMALAVVVGNDSIAKAQREVNTLTNRIKQSESALEELKV